MQTEIEAKFPDINPEALRKNLKSIGATQIHPERLMKRQNFDYPDKRLEKIGAWVRVRDEGDKITLSYKQVTDWNSVHGTKDVTVEVGDFKKTRDFLLTLGLENKAHQETKRERWEWKGVEITVDTWPWIPTFVELEASEESLLRTLAAKLNLEWNRALHGSVETVYKQYFDVMDPEIYNCPTVAFGPVPDWLEAKRIKKINTGA